VSILSDSTSILRPARPRGVTTSLAPAAGVCQVHCRPLRAPVPLAAVSETFSALPAPAIRGGNPAKGQPNGWGPQTQHATLADPFSYWAAEPREVYEFTAAQTDPFPQLQSLLTRYRLIDSRREAGADNPSSPATAGPAEAPGGAEAACPYFLGGWIGYFGYELGRHIERLPERAVDDVPVPVIRLCFYDRVLAYDHRRDTFWLIALEMPTDPEKPAEKLAGLERHLERAAQLHEPELARADLQAIGLAGLRRNMTREAYLDAVQRIKRYIRDGDVYQVNYSHRFEQPFEGRPVQLFHWQNRFNPSGYAAYMDAGTFQIVSASPEMFVTIRDRVIETKPIKGTRPRWPDSDPHTARFNARQFQELLTSAKEQAELNMIIDLERNDVARICKPGTRRVVQPRTIEAYASVFHAVATIAGALRDEVTFPDVLRAVFPGGSITGAPKIRSMEIIDELEPTTRGVYTGAIGYLGVDGTICLNIAIRTVLVNGGRAFVQTGGGIVADSDPQAEWAETITKARALLAGITAVGRGQR
jgi:para-aminobenzoate synthetase component 1